MHFHFLVFTFILLTMFTFRLHKTQSIVIEDVSDEIGQGAEPHLADNGGVRYTGMSKQ